MFIIKKILKTPKG